MKERIERNRIIIGDAYEQLIKLPDANIDTVITSPPYFGLRDYGHWRQVGLESNVELWADRLLTICREIGRVLKPSGSLWLNLGDSFSNHPRQGTPNKSLLLGPQRLALKLVRDGWLLRNQIIWAKPNGMPSSVTDRFSCKYEVILLLVRSRHYFFDLDPVRERPISPRRPKTVGSNLYLPPDAQPPRHYGLDLNAGLSRLKAAGHPSHRLGKNPGDVWTQPTGGYRGAHFATFPLRLIERPLLATCPECVCAACGAPWRRQTADRGPNPSLGLLRPDCGCRAAGEPGIVLDPFLGSGTVAIAAEQHGRDWIGIELNPRYAALAKQRLADHRSKPS
jgi:DNA modification methylase